MAKFTMKSGATFRAKVTYTDANGNPMSMTLAGVTARSSLLDPDGTRRLDLTITPLDQTAYPGRFDVTGDTTGWPIGCSQWDILYVVGSDKAPTETYIVEFEEAVTL